MGAGIGDSNEDLIVAVVDWDDVGAEEGVVEALDEEEGLFYQMHSWVHVTLVLVLFQIHAAAGVHQVRELFR